MDFDEYIEMLGKFYKLTKVDDSTYILHKEKKTLELTPQAMYDKDEILQRLNDIYPDVEIKEDPSIYSSTRMPSNIRGGRFGHVGVDDLHPGIGRRPNSRPKGSIASPRDLLDQEESEEGIDKTDIFPLKNKRDPDSDHFKKQGGDDDNPFLY